MARLRPLGLVVLAALAACQDEPSRLQGSGTGTRFAIAEAEPADQEPRELPIVEIDEEDDRSDEVAAAPNSHDPHSAAHPAPAQSSTSRIAAPGAPH